MRSFWYNVLRGAVLFLLVGVGAAGCSSDAPSGASADEEDTTATQGASGGASPAGHRAAVSVPDSARYVGDAPCASCHPDVAASYQKTGHAQSVSAFDPSTAPESFAGDPAVHHEKSTLTYEPFVRGSALYQREVRRGPEGDTVHQRVHRVDLVIGSGNATRSYMMAVNGYYTEMPLTWYADQQTWDMSPGYEEENGRFGRPINRECMTCHTGRPERSRFTQNHYPEVPGPITCERCHGPGETHVQRQRARQSGPATDSSTADERLAIVTPTDLPREEQLSVCQQCHLAGVTVFKPGETPSTFRPGEPLRANRTVYVPKKQLETPNWVGIDSHPIRLARSACFKNSDMTCATCHDAHEPASATTTAEYNTTCKSCHGGERSAEPVCARPGTSSGRPVSRKKAMTGNCVDCHMQKGGTSNVPHVTFTDHWIRRRPEPRDSSSRVSALSSDAPLDLVPLRRMVALDGSNPPPGGRADIEATIAYFRFYERMHRHPEYIDRAIARGRKSRFPAGDADGRIALARALAETDSVGAAAAVMRTAVRSTDDAWAHYWYGAMNEERGRTRAAIASYRKALRLQPRMLEAQVQLAGALFRAGRLGAAEAQLRTVVDYNPVYSARSWFNLGVIRLKDGRPASARDAFAEAIRVDPDLVQGHMQLGRLASKNNRYTAAVDHFRRALAVDSTHAKAYGSLGIVYLQTNRPAQARRMFRKVLELDPNNRAARRILRKLSR
ncbi:MAG: tetratricopeptide repeat protein [Salinibacter sp.]